MPNTFEHGYALLIGVGSNKSPDWSLPVTIADAQAIYNVLVAPDLCAYDPAQVRLLADEDASRQDILDGLNWLASVTAHDEDATAFFYFSGHGWADKQTGRYYLIPWDLDGSDVETVRKTALDGETFAEALRQVRPKKLVSLIDACFAGGTSSAKGPEAPLPAGFAKAAPPSALLNELKKGEGRVALASSSADQESWIRPDRTRSIFTDHFIKALKGGASRPGDTTVNILDVFQYLVREVPASAKEFYEAQQTPRMDAANLDSDFPIALLMGGKGLKVQDIAPQHITATAPTGPSTVVPGRRQLNQRLIKSFSLDELNDLIFELGLSPDDIAGNTVRAKARELVLYCERRDRLGDLHAAIERMLSE
jgi:hypothetical protein